MKGKTFFVLIAVFAIGACGRFDDPFKVGAGSVNPENQGGDVPEELYVLSGILGGYGTSSPTWAYDDRISILWEGGTYLSSGDTAGAEKAFSFNVKPDGNVVYAVYPHDLEASISDGILSVDIPSEQDGTFKGALVETAMVSSEVVVFQPYSAMIEFTVTTRAVSRIAISCSGEQHVSLKVSGCGTYYASLLPGEYADGLEIELYNETGELLCKKITDIGLLLDRGTITSLGVLDSFYVSASGRGTGTGDCWENAISWSAFRSEIVEGTAFGTYHLTEGVYTSDATQMSKSVAFTIIGGYSSTSSGTDLSKRDTDSYPTVFDGQGSKRIFLWLQSSGESIRTIFDGVVFQNATWKGATGSALVVQTCKEAFFRNCIIRNNTNEDSRNGAVVRVVGGEDSDVRFSDCIFQGNISEGPGGVFVVATNANLRLERCDFLDNQSFGTASVLLCTGSKAVIKMNKCHFERNSSLQKGVIAVSNATAKVYMNSCSFYGNEAGDYASCLYLASGVTGLYNCAFADNINTGGDADVSKYSTIYGEGGKIILANTSIRISDILGVGFLAGANSTAIMVNNIISHTDRNTVSLKIDGNTALSLGHNIYSCLGTSSSSTYVPVDADIEAKIAQEWDSEGRFLLWNGIMPEGFAKATITDVANAVGDNETGFLEWLRDEVVYSTGSGILTDIRGMQRNISALWPGAYENQ